MKESELSMKIWELDLTKDKEYIDNEDKVWKVNNSCDDLINTNSGVSITGLYSLKRLKELELIEAIDWSKVEVDTKILVSNDEEDWERRHFAKYENGTVYTWCSGATSFSTDNKDYTIDWHYAKLYKE